MNILQIVSSLEEISGPANSLYLVASGLVKKGHKVICAHYVGTQGPLVKRLQSLGIEVINLNPKNKKAGRLDRILMVLRLISIVSKNKIGVIHAHNWDADCYAFLTAFFIKVRIVVTLHSRSYFDWVKAHEGKYRNWFIKKCSKFVCVSEQFRKEFIGACGIPAAKTAVVYNCPHDSFFAPNEYDNYQKIRKEFSVANDQILLGSVGNFTKFKGIIHLLRALELLRGRKLRLLLVGEDVAGLRPLFDEFIVQHSLADDIIFAGFRQDIPAILDALDIFVFPSTEEADPIALSEAMAKAKPVIATRIAAMAEKIEDKKNGLLVDPAAPEQLAKAIDYYLQDRQRMDETGARARTVMQERYSYETMIDSYEQLYKAEKVF